jgi:hypothetical protein
MDYSTTYYYQPTISSPSPNYCQSTPEYECAMSIWSGIFNGVSGGELAQSGTAGTVSCPNGGSCQPTSYVAWWELVPCNNQATCNNIPVYPSNEYEAVEENGLSWGGSQNQWQMYVVDETAGKLCQSPVINYAPTYWPNFAETVFETPKVNGNTVCLPQFTSASNTGNGACYYYNSINSCTGFSTLYNDMWGSAWNMYNNCWGNYVYNIILGQLASDSFSSTYNTSCGTG